MLEPEPWQLAAIFCTSAGGVITLKNGSWVLCYAREQPKLTASRLAPNPLITSQTLTPESNRGRLEHHRQFFEDIYCKKFVDVQSLKGDPFLRQLLIDLVPQWNKYRWSPLQVVEIEDRHCWHFPRDIDHVVVMYTHRNFPEVRSYCKLELQGVRLDLRHCDVVYLYKPPTFIECSHSVPDEPCCISYLSAHLPQDRDDTTATEQDLEDRLEDFHPHVSQTHFSP